MRILGVDPGTIRTGIGLIESEGSRCRLLHCGVISAPSSLPLPERLHRIHTALRGIIRGHRPSVLALENVFFGKDVQAMVKIGEARACAMLAASERGIAVVEYAPARVKQSVTGTGRATKEQIQYMVKNLLRLDSLPPADSADALAVAICHCHLEKSPGRRGEPSSGLRKKKAKTWAQVAAERGAAKQCTNI